MASFPCELCGSRFRGQAAYMYPAVVAGREARRERYRLCPECANDVMTGAVHRLSPVLDHQYPEPSFCYRCRQPQPEDTPLAAAFFLTWYANDERVDYYGGLCGACAQLPEVPLLRGAP